jgi:hypothetical protein
MNFRSRHYLISYFSTVILIMAATVTLSAQRLITPRASQKATVVQTIGVTDVKVTYSRPAVKGRTVWAPSPEDKKGEKTLDDSRGRPDDAPLVYYGHLWRTGANEATVFQVTNDVLINGQPLPAGKYSLHTIPEKDEWTVIFNKVDDQWGSFFYDAAKDALRVKSKPQWVSDSQELMTFTIDPLGANSATVSLRWEKINVPFTVEVKDPDAAALAFVTAQVDAAKADDANTPLNAARWARENKAPEQTAKWTTQALAAIDSQIKAKPTMANLAQKSTILLFAGKSQEALEFAQKAVAQGKADGQDTSALEKSIADRTKAKP